jgi:hypothetical protein
MEQAAAWQQEQSQRVSTFKPKKPQMPNDRRCAKGDTLCKSKIPPHPPGTLNEPFLPNSGYPVEWIAVMVAASAVFLLLTLR